MIKNKENSLSAVLQEKLLKLESEEEIVREKLKMAQLDGDLSENADWKILNEKLQNLQEQIFLLKEKLFLLKGKTNQEILVTYCLLESDEKKTVKLTDEWDIDPSEGKISVLSPLGLALIDKKIGEISEVKTKAKIYKVQIINIKK